MDIYTNEPNDVILFLIQKIEKLENELLECQLRSIEARNPGINIEEVRQHLIEQRDSMKDIP